MRWTRVVLFLRYQPEDERRPPRSYLALVAGKATDKKHRAKSSLGHIALPNYSAGALANMAKVLKPKRRQAEEAA
jgi:hypothetical protein